jgi:hypothetical protein
MLPPDFVLIFGRLVLAVCAALGLFMTAIYFVRALSCCSFASSLI